MINELDKRKLRFVISPTRFYPENVGRDIARAYGTWKESWGHAFKVELNVADPLYSDNFSRQSHVAMIFHGDETLGLCTLNAFNLNQEQDLDDSYFKVWPSEIIAGLKREMPHLLSCCNATIGFKYRKNNLGFSGIDLIFTLINLYLRSTSYQGILGTARIEKKVPEACKRTAATILARNVPFTIPGQFIDLVCWRRDLDLNLWNPEMRELSEFIWNRSTYIFQSTEGVQDAA